ncbi:MAG TPA: sulfatase-like hydrolase/transferase [Solirubrobacterales bacterium]|nr:sulfatase-like hydrolase/transferase [Solirubrobacterales bacterium]HNG57009.1 sulfatase-like hydrolase/transferase [Solirubrobacterales bacterium]
MAKKKKGKSVAKPPNLLLIITDQQRYPMHWPEDQEWLDELMPADAELARTGVTFEETCIASCMCSPSRASLFTGRWPAEHGVDLTLTRGGAEIDRSHSKHALRKGIEAVRHGEMSALEMVTNTVKGAARRANGGTDERELDPNMENLPSVLKRAGYKTVLKGKWHLTQPVGSDWSQADAERLADEYGFEGWVPPDAGENIEPSHFGGGNKAGKSKEGYDEDFTRQAEEFLADPPDEPWALIFSLVNPHDVLGYPSSYEEGGYSDREWADLDAVQLPPSVDETMKNKPRVHSLLKIGQLSFLGPIEGEQRLEYCRFYAHLHRLADAKIGRVLEALGDPEDPDSLRSKTVIFRTSDHGDLGMSHGGLRQKMFNAYEETVNVPLIVSNPQMFPEARRTNAPASLCDVLPTMAELAGADTEGLELRGRSLVPVLKEEAESVQEGTLFTYDDHQSGTAYRDVTPGANRIRAWRTPEATYAIYLNPHGGPPEFELYDRTRDPDQVNNLVDRDSGRAINPADRELLEKMRAGLKAEMRRCRVPALPATIDRLPA